MMKFPADFIWGAASAAYQIEGHDLADGGGTSIWRTFSHTPGKVAWDDTGDIACDAYYRFEEDLDLLAQTGAKAYRFSTSWSRVDPLGDGNWNEKGLAYYDRLVNACLDRGLTPFLTLYHWELPQALEDLGGWQVRETAEAFARFAAMMAEHFKGRVKNYFTLNEPQCSVSLGYEQGIHAPGKKLPREKVFTCLLNQMLAHIYTSNNNNLEKIKPRITELIVVLSRAAVDAGADINEIFLINENFTTNIEEFTNLEDLSIWVTNMLQRFISFTFEFDKVKHADAVYKVIEFIKANFQRRMSLEEIAASTYLSKTYLSSLFKKETGYSISEYINIVRIERSKSLLLEENISIIDIANLCGFEDQSYFTKVFKHIVGITPKKYRENRGKNMKKDIILK